MKLRMTNFDCEKILHHNEELIWSGNPIAGTSSLRIVFQLTGAYIMLLCDVLYILTPPEYKVGENEFMADTIIPIILVVLSCLSVFLIIEPFIEKLIHANTTFIITNQRIITIIKDKMRETVITKKIAIKIWNTKNNTIVIGLNTKSGLYKWNYNPLMDYLAWNYKLYPHYLYGIEYQAYIKIRDLVESI